MSGPSEDRLVDWASLPEGLLGCILRKLLSIYDFARFASVCKNWLSVARGQIKERLGNPTQRQLPVLLMPTGDNSETHRAMYDVARGRVLGSQWHVPYNKRCCGSSFGWLIFAKDNLALTLFNPFTGEAIHLPQVTEPMTEEEIGDAYYNHEYEFAKVILSADPSIAPDTFEVAALSEFCWNIFFFRSGDREWFNLGFETPEDARRFEDINYYEGRFYAANEDGVVVSFEICREENHPEDSKAVLRTLADLTLGGTPDKSYLVESLSGSLLLVRRFMNDYPSGFAGASFEIQGRVCEFDPKKQPLTSTFHVYKLVPVMEGTKCHGHGHSEGEHFHEHCHSVRLTALADEALFLGHSHSMSVKASDFLGCRPSSIYFTDDFIDFPPPYRPLGAIDIGIFSMEDEHVERLSLIDQSQSHMPPPIWIAPKAKID